MSTIRTSKNQSQTQNLNFYNRTRAPTLTITQTPYYTSKLKTYKGNKKLALKEII